jgi:hypothetical protein
MLLSHRYKFIYLKTMKSAGTSVEALLEHYCLPPGTKCGTHSRTETISEHGIAGGRFHKHSFNDEYYNHMRAETVKAKVGDDIWNSYFKFCNVRNPWDRMVSLYFNMNLKRLDYLRTAEFSDVQARFYKWARNKNSRSHMDDHLIYTLDGSLAVDDVVRYETLHEDMARICKHLNIQYRPNELPKWKSDWRVRPESYRDYYIDQKVIDDVARGHQFEIDQFGYTF